MIYKRMFLCITYRFFCIENPSRGQYNTLKRCPNVALFSLNLWNFPYDFYDN